jgi:hypothetical protein
MQAEHQLGFFKSLFDFKLKHFITIKVLRILNIISVVWHLSFGTVFLIAGLFGSATTGIEKVAIVIGTPLVTLLLIIVSRLWIEFIANIYRIGDNTQKLVDNLPTS